MGTLDDPAASRAGSHASDFESKLPGPTGCPSLPATATAQDRTPEDLAKLTTLQHPDHDTAEWPL